MVYGRAISQAAAWYRKAADQDHLVAQLNLGLLYDNGQGVRQDHVEAAAWYRKAAEQGNADAQFNLGGLYNDGQGVRKSYARAAAWYEKAAGQGHAYAQHNLGCSTALVGACERIIEKRFTGIVKQQIKAIPLHNATSAYVTTKAKEFNRDHTLAAGVVSRRQQNRATPKHSPISPSFTLTAKACVKVTRMPIFGSALPLRTSRGRSGNLLQGGLRRSLHT